MANIFSGLLGKRQQGGSSAIDLARYKQELEDYGIDRDAFSQKKALKNIDPYIKQVLESMSPERQDQLLLQRRMMGEGPLFKKGMEGFTSTIKQRGNMISASAAEEEDLQAKKDFLDYKIENPELTDWQKNIKAFNKLGDNSGVLTPAQIEALKTKRGEKFLEQEDQYVSTWDANKAISKRLIEGGITKKLVPEYATRLNEFHQTVDAAEDALNFTQNRRDDIQKLYKETHGFTTGPGSLLAGFVFTDAADWKRLKETVISNIGLSKIMELKASSAQGATGLGALNEAELTMLQNHAGNLEGATNPEEIKRILRRLDRDLKAMQNRRMKGLSREKIFYNSYKQYLPYGNNETYMPPDEVKHLFTGGEYKRPIVENLPLEEEQSLDALLDKYAPPTGQ